jgi:hypothetical protein
MELSLSSIVAKKARAKLSCIVAKKARAKLSCPRGRGGEPPIESNPAKGAKSTHPADFSAKLIAIFPNHFGLHVE